ncbi:beta-galactosidase [Agarivorans sp. JK6]|uniref:beta-galactosidase n=1 Tax=Agarivorans sp. JK6 TaxID=2997426 RepID=UPI003872CE39
METRLRADSAKTISEHEQSILIYDFAEQIPKAFSFSNVDAELVSEGNGITTGSQALKVTTHSKENFYTSIFIEPEQPFDWSALPNFSFAFDVTNLGRRSTQIFINIFDKQGQMHSRSINVAGGSCKTYLNELKGEFLKGGLNYESGFRSNPAAWDTPFHYATWMWGEMNIDLSAVAKIELSIHGTLIDHQLVLDNFRVIFTPECNPNFLKGCLDKFGQNALVETAEKVHSEEELLAVTAKELKALEQGAMPQRSRFSGYTGGPQLEATGFFRTEKIDGKWSLVDPDGYPYFATGLDIIRLANSFTITGIDYDHSKVAARSDDDVTPEDSKEKLEISQEAFDSAYVANQTRRDFFDWLPSYDDPLAEHYSYMRELFEGPVDRGEIFSFYSANLQRKYGQDGADYMGKWREVTMDRMLNWGFSCLGNWTAPEFYSNDKIPYFANGWIIGDFKTVTSGDDFWAPLPDPFDPVFRERAEATVSQVKAEMQGSPWCVGIFIDNEKSWGRMGTINGHYGIAIHTLGRSDEESPTKAVFTQALKDKYGTVEQLNQAWGTNIDSWQAVAGGVSDLAHNEAQLSDYSMLLELYASEYFKVVNESLKAQLPNHLYLGARFADWGCNPEVVRAAAKHVDVVSYNYYKEGLHPEPWKFLAEVDMPSIIGEFHIGVKEGFFHAGLVTANDQTERGEMFEDYLNSVIDNPYFVGAHWFQYIDSPITGRSFDGENYNVGFVGITDVPYQPMVDAAKRLNGGMYQRRFNKAKK